MIYSVLKIRCLLIEYEFMFIHIFLQIQKTEIALVLLSFDTKQKLSIIYYRYYNTFIFMTIHLYLSAELYLVIEKFFWLENINPFFISNRSELSPFFSRTLCLRLLKIYVG